MFEVFKEFTFEAAHSLPHLPDNHKCHRVHGHSYRVQIFVRGEIDPKTKFVMDYATISHWWESLNRKLDHFNLNDVIEGETTSENLAKWIYGKLKQYLPGLAKVIVFETATAGASYWE